jgi:hypothetical protein
MYQALNGVSPVEYYLALCAMRVEWPTTYDNVLSLNATHEQCDNVREITTDMT